MMTECYYKLENVIPVWKVLKWNAERKAALKNIIQGKEGDQDGHSND